MKRKPRKGDRLVYVGPYAPSVPEDAKYPPGLAVRFREYGEKVTVRLDTEEELYADWPVELVKHEQPDLDFGPTGLESDSE